MLVGGLQQSSYSGSECCQLECFLILCSTVSFDDERCSFCFVVFSQLFLAKNVKIMQCILVILNCSRSLL